MVHPSMIPPNVRPHLSRSRSHTATSPTSTQPSRSSTAPLSLVSSATTKRSSSAEPDPAERAPRAASTLPATSSPEKAQSRAKDKVERHHRLGLHTHFPHPHLHHALAGLHDSNHHRSHSRDSRHHRRIKTDVQTPTILVNDSLQDQSFYDDRQDHHHSHHHHAQAHLHLPHINNDSGTMLRRMNSSRSYNSSSGRPRAVSDSSRPHGSHETPTQANSRPQPLIRVPTTAQLISSRIDQAEAKRKARLAGATKADLTKLRLAARNAEDELRTRLNEIAKTSTEITRRLDYTYYNLLEKLGQLVATVASFKSLLNQTEDLSTDFAKSISASPGTGGLQADVNRDLAEFQKGLETSEGRIAELEQRLKAGSLKASELGDRLETCRRTVSRWEEREREWKEKVDARLRFFWICGAVIILVSLLLGIWWENGGLRKRDINDAIETRNYTNSPVDSPNGSEKDLMRRLDTMPEDVQDMLKSAMIQGSSKRASTPPLASAPPPLSECPVQNECTEDDVRLRLFDEL
ncbi:MAG: hypothetical protein Q9227_003582 [Pyrenula ochraceoflavens]